MGMHCSCSRVCLCCRMGCASVHKTCCCAARQMSIACASANVLQAAHSCCGLQPLLLLTCAQRGMGG